MKKVKSIGWIKKFIRTITTNYKLFLVFLKINLVDKFKSLIFVKTKVKKFFENISKGSAIIAPITLTNLGSKGWCFPNYSLLFNNR